MPSDPDRSGAAPAAELDVALGHLRGKRHAEGLAALARLHQTYPTDQQVLGNYAFAALNQGRWQQAEQLLEHLVSVPGRPGVWSEWYYRAWAAAARGDFDRALQYCYRACDMAPGKAEPRVLGAAAALRLHRPGEGVRLLAPLSQRQATDHPTASHRAALDDSHPGLDINAVSLWILCTCFVRLADNPGQMPVDREPWAVRVCAALARTARRLPLPARTAERRSRWLWRLWAYQRGFGAPCFGIVRTPLAPAAVEHYQRVVDATIDELLQFPLCPLATYLQAMIRSQDALALYSWTHANPPRTFVHVGCFVGASACLSALAMSAAGRGSGGRIITIDPYLAGATLDPDKVFERIASRVGVSHMIERHTGYFNHVTPWESAAGEGSCMKVIGRTILERVGRADAFLVDGDHREIGVVADVLLASEFLADGGTILLHDVHSHPTVRRGLLPFLVTPTVRERFKYQELAPWNIDGVGVLRKRRDGLCQRLRRDAR